jgi:ATP-binding cassette subfamily B protein
MGFFAGLNTEKYDRQYSDRQLIGRIIDYFKPQGRRFTWVSILVALIAAIAAALPVIVSQYR